jgi:hypothetical protein
VAEGLNHLQLSHLQRKALIIISDGGDNASHSKRSEILALARQSQVVIYSIVLEDEFTKEQDPKVLRQLSEDTGGVAFFPESQQSVVESSAQIAMDLRDQYVLGFVPEKRGRGKLFHKVQVKVTAYEKGKLHVRTRAGYSVASGPLWTRVGGRAEFLLLPLGPLELADFIGLDTCLSIMQVLYEGLADSKYRPCPLLVKYVEAGWLGRKTKRGFYDYRGEKPMPTR